MNQLPDFESYGYHLLEVLGNKIQGGRITYKAVELATNDEVVIKQFRFISSESWSLYQQVEREINVLQGLTHRRIPHYRKTINHPDGICLVQDYLKGYNLNISRTFTPEQIKNIAIQFLEILVYLQNRIPPIIHRDIKPENILFEEISSSLSIKNGDEIKVYLVDFGLAKIGNQESALSSVISGTPGFMPPEQILGKPASNASDLYGLGATIICLMTGIKSTKFNQLVESNFSIKFRHLVNQYNIQFVVWLEKMVNPEMNQCFASGKSALNALTVIENLARSPEVNIDQTELFFEETKRGEILSKMLIVSNNTSDTVLQGKWSVKNHENDPPHSTNDHSWIHFEPQEFTGNYVRCKVIVDTNQLKTDKVGERTIILKSNSEYQYDKVKLKVKTLPVPITTKKPTYLALAMFLIGAILWGGFILPIKGAMSGAIFGAVTGVLFGAIGLVIRVAIDVVIGVAISQAIDQASSFTIDFAICSTIYLAICLEINKLKKRGFTDIEAAIYLFLTCICGTSIGWLSLVEIDFPAILGLGYGSATLIPKLINPPRQQKQLVEKWRKKEQYLIEP